MPSPGLPNTVAAQGTDELALVWLGVQRSTSKCYTVRDGVILILNGGCVLEPVLICKLAKNTTVSEPISSCKSVIDDRQLIAASSEET